MYCWANDVAAARLDGAFRPVNLIDVVRQFENAGKDPSRDVYKRQALRRGFPRGQGSLVWSIGPWLE